MKRLFPIILFASSALAQSITVTPTGPVAKVGEYQTLTAQIADQNDVRVSWAITSGPGGATLVGDNPSTKNEPSTISLHTTTTGTYVVTATSVTGGLTATSTVVVIAAPTPVAGNPKFGGLNSSNLAAMKTKANTGTNALYANGLWSIATGAVPTMNSIWSWSDTGSGLPNVDVTFAYNGCGPGGAQENNAYYFSLEEMLDPADATWKWGSKGRDITMYFVNYWLDPLDNSYDACSGLYRPTDANFMLGGDRASNDTPPFTLGPDWQLGSGFAGGGSGATMTAAYSTCAANGTVTNGSQSITGVSVTSGTCQVGMEIAGTGIPTGNLIAAISGSTYTMYQPATAGGSSFTAGGLIASVTGGGTGYLPNSTVWWYALDAGALCPQAGMYGSGIGYFSGPNGIRLAARGTAKTNGSGVVVGPVFYLTNIIGCTSAPAITVKSDKQVLRDYLAIVGQSIIQNNGGTGTVAPWRCDSGGCVWNTSAEFNGGGPYDFVGQVAMGNNYTHSKLMYLLAAGATFDDNNTDDPPLTGNHNTCSATRYQVCVDGSAGSLHAYLKYLSGGMLYKDWAHISDPDVTWPAYNAAYSNLPTTPTCNDPSSTTTASIVVPCFGDARHGESSEGSWYDYSFYRETLAMASLVSAGLDDPSTSTGLGPQMSITTDSFWDLKADSDLRGLKYYWDNSSNRWQFTTTGDAVSHYHIMNDFHYAGWLMVQDALTGRTDRKNKLLWPIINSPLGGISNFYHDMNNANGNYLAIPLFLALPIGDPTSSPPSDPRPSLPTEAYSFNNGHITALNAWVTNGPEWAADTSPSPVTQQRFEAFAQNTRINHASQWSGGFWVQSNGEDITTMRMVSENYNYQLNTAQNSNILGIGSTQDATRCGIGYYQGPTCMGATWWSAQNYGKYNIVVTGTGSTYAECLGAAVCLSTDAPGSGGSNWTTVSGPRGGGQYWQQTAQGNAYMNHVTLADRVAYDIDTTLLYNGSCVSVLAWCGTLSGVTGASRSLIYLRNLKTVVFEDRSAGGISSFDNLNTVGPLTITGQTGKWTTRSGNQDAYETLLTPTSGIIMEDRGGYFTQGNNPGFVADGEIEPYSTLTEDAGNPATEQYLNVLQWGASGFTRPTTTLVQSSAGQGYDAALLGGTTLAAFMRGWTGSTAFTGTTIPASGATTVYVSDLTPNTVYAVTGAGTPANCTSDNAGVCMFAATGTGNVTVTPSGVVAAPTQLQGVILKGVTVN